MWPLPKDALYAIIAFLALINVQLWPSYEAAAEVAILGVKPGEWLLAIVTLMLWAATIRSVKAAKDQLTLAFPPRLMVSNFIIYTGEDIRSVPKMQPDEAIHANVWIRNCGRESAKIIRSSCELCWCGDILPMVRPYDSESPAELENTPKKLIDVSPINFAKADNFEPGDTGKWEIGPVFVPEDYGYTVNLYIIGHIIYKDRLGGQHFNLFARKYDPGLRRFIAVENNPDYNSDG